MNLQKAFKERWKVVGIIALIGVILGFFVLSPFAMYISHVVHMKLPVHKMSIRDVFKPNLLLWSMSFTILGGAIGIVIGFLYYGVYKRTKEIKEAKEYTDLIINNINDGMVTIDRDYRIVSANRAFLETSHYSLDEVKGKYCYEVSHGIKEPCKSPQHQCPLNEVLETGVSSTVIHKHIDKDGNILFVEITATPIRDEEGNIIEIIEISKDITEQKKAEEALKESERKYRNLVDNTLVGIFKSNINGEILYLNKAMSSMFGFDSPEEMMQVNALTVYKNPKDREVLIENLRKSGTVNNYELELQTKTGSHLNVIFNASLENDILSGMILDITKRKQAEEELTKHRFHLEELVEKRTEELSKANEQLQQEITDRKRAEEQIKQYTSQLEAANKELEAFSYSASHDLKSPLRAIDGFSNALLEDYSDKLDDEGKRVLNIIRTSTQQMSQLINDLLQFSRLSRQQIKSSNIDMDKLVKDVLKELKPIDRTVELNIHTLPPSYGDVTMIRQVFFNLLSNAIKFTRPREKAVIEVGSMVEGNENVYYYVRDNGVGFDMQYADKLFGVFQRLHSSEEFEGTGVGLAIVQRIIHRHGGRVWAEGKVNEGATFYFTLPERELIHKSDYYSEQSETVNSNSVITEKR